RSLAPLRHRRYAALWTGAFASNVGTWMETVGVGILVTSQTGQAGWAGIVAAAAFLPNALVGPLGGALADRLPRRRLLLATTTVQTVLAATLAALAAVGAARPWAVTAIVFTSGCANALGLPSFQALLPDLVPRDELTGAVALSSAQWNLGRVIGPAIAGVVIGVGGYSLAFAINAASFLAVIVAVAPLRLPAPTPVPGETVRQAIGSGARYAWRDPGIRAVIVYLALNSLLAAPFIALVPAVALRVFHDAAGGTAALVTAQGAGAVVMALVLSALVRRLGLRRTVLGCLAVLPLALLAYAAAPTLAAGAAAIFFVGALYLGCLSSFTTIAQLRAPAALRGRVLSVFFVLLGLLYPIGSIVQGAIADAVGLPATTAGAAALLAASFVVVRAARRGFDRDLDDLAHPAPAPLGAVAPSAQ
ncbi:MAG TPA: MFS transporter, partial [Acidimicrobiia bacterium]|nr:MFS transporter [Acidimicrobiia bacterium]